MARQHVHRRVNVILVSVGLQVKQYFQELPLRRFNSSLEHLIQQPGALRAFVVDNGLKFL